MNILLWVLQALLALYYAMGGGWMMSKVSPGFLKIMPKPAWMVIGLLQILLALGLVLPGALKFMPLLTPLSAVGVAVETMAVSLLGKPNTQGLVWAAVPALLVLFVAYGRYALVPF